MDEEIVEEFEGIDELRRRAEGGDAVAMRLLAGRLRWDDDVPRDERLALKWLKRAAELNEPEACYELAESYRYGSCGLRPNAARAFFYHTMASELGELESTYVLAFEYLYHGRLTELNPAKGAQLLKTVADAGFNSDAMFWYAVSCVNALGVPRDLQTARYWLRRCLENSPRHPDAPGLLAEIEAELGGECLAVFHSFRSTGPSCLGVDGSPEAGPVKNIT